MSESPLLDKNGLTEEEFLRAYDPTKWERPSATADVILYCVKTGSMLLVKRGGHPFISKWALPGGFLEPHETLEQAAARELMEETGVKATNLKQLRVFSAPDRDPRTRIITTAFVSFTDEERFAAGDDAAEAAFFKVKREVLASRFDGVETTGRIRLNSGKDVIQFMYRKAYPRSPYPADPEYTCSGAGRIAGDHAVIIACALDYISDVLGARG